MKKQIKTVVYDEQLRLAGLSKSTLCGPLPIKNEYYVMLS